MRKGAGRGTGKGYKNLRSFPRDASIHSQSAKGMKQPQKIPVDIKRKIESGELRQKYGLDTDSGSMYYKLRNLAGDGDTEAQYKVFQSRGIVRKESDLWKSMTFTEKLNLVQEAELVDGVADKRIGELTVNEIELLTEALDRREFTSLAEQKKIREKNIEFRRSLQPVFKDKSAKEKGIKTYQVVPPKEEVMKLVKNLVEIEGGKKVLKIPCSRLDFKNTYDFIGFTKSGNVIIKESSGVGGNRKILKPYVFHGDLYIQTGNHGYILDLQTGR